jgi:parvulin-like peptidyl-prolyl isomerase
MTTRWWTGIAVLSLMSILPPTAGAAAGDLPVVKGKRVVASVLGEPVTLDELEWQVAAARREQAGTGPTRTEELAVLKRMIDVRLIAAEARRMGLDKLPEIRQMVDSFARVALREELAAQVAAGAKADPQEVEKVYRDAVREWKVSAALFDKEEHAKSLAAELEAGKAFRDTAQAFVAAGKALRADEGVLLRRGATDPPIARALAAMAVGGHSPVVRTRSSFVIVSLEDLHYPDDPQERAKAEQTVLAARRREAVAAFDRTLRAKWVKADRRLLQSIDYEADSPGFDALLKDRRVLARIKGEQPVTVGDLTDELRFLFFHGTKMAAERKRLNAKKEQVFDGIVHRKVFRKEALRRGLHKTDAYRTRVDSQERSALFEVFLRKAIAPDIRLEEAEVRAYYERHRTEYTTPEMVRLRSLAFGTRRQAEAASESLRTGADFQWVRDRAEGQLDRNTPGLVSFEGLPIMTTELPDGARKAVAGTNAGDVRLWASPEDHFHVLVVEKVVPAQPQPFEEVRTGVTEKLVNAKVQEAVEAYAEKLRALSDVKVYLKPS